MINLAKDKEKEELAKDVSGFANSSGGRILVGVRNKPRRLEGLSRALEIDRILESMSDRIYPPVNLHIYSLPWKDKFIGYIQVPKGRFVHELIRSRVTYVRCGSITDRATTSEIYRLKSEREHLSRTILLGGGGRIATDNRISLFGNRTHGVVRCSRFLCVLALSTFFFNEKSQPA